MGTWLLNDVLNPPSQGSFRSDVEGETLDGYVFYTLTFYSNPYPKGFTAYFDIEYNEGTNYYDNSLSGDYIATGRLDGSTPTRVEKNSEEGIKRRTLIITGGVDVDEPILCEWLNDNATKID